jgi:hypothetical protein
MSPQHPRWSPRTEADLQQAIDDELLEESHYFEAKGELTTGKASNREHARDLASFAVDSGMLAIGIGEDKATNGFLLNPQPLNGLAERVESIALTIPDPPLPVVLRPILSAADPSRGYLLVHVPVSPLRPHMVDHRYLGRGERSKVYLSDAEVARLHGLRHQAEADVHQLLTAEIDRDPVSAAERKHSHLFLLAQPAASTSNLLLPIFDAPTARQQLSEIVQAVGKLPIADLVDGGFAPDYDMATQIHPRAAGMAASSYQIGRGRAIIRNPQTLHSEDALDIEFRYDGGIRVWMGRLSERDHNDHEVVAANAAVLQTRRLIALTTAIAETGGYLGNWDLGFAATGLLRRGVYLGQQAFDQGYVYDVDEEINTTSATYAELTARPATVADRLVGRLLRTYGVRPRFAAALTDPTVTEPAE